MQEYKNRNIEEVLLQLNDEDKEKLYWNCDGTELFPDGCKSGIKEWGLYPEIQVWGCHQLGATEDENCDIDLCKACVQWTLY